MSVSDCLAEILPFPHCSVSEQLTLLGAVGGDPV